MYCSLQPLSFVLYEGSQAGDGSSRVGPGSPTDDSLQDNTRSNSQQPSRHGTAPDLQGERQGQGRGHSSGRDATYRLNPSQHSDDILNPTRPYPTNTRTSPLPARRDPYPASTHARPNTGSQQGGHGRNVQSGHQVSSNYVPGRSYISPESVSSFIYLKQDVYICITITKVDILYIVYIYILYIDRRDI
jgi:hypothetical protein